MTIEVEVDRDLCIGSENCTRYAPRSFQTSDDGKAVFTRGAADSDEHIHIAVTACPVGALTIRE